MVRMLAILWLSWSPPAVSAGPAETQTQTQTQTQTSIWAQLGEQVPFAEALDLCTTRIANEVEPDLGCADELAAKLKQYDIIALLASSQDDELNIRKRICVVATGKESCELRSEGRPRSGIEALWQAADRSRQKLITLLESIDETENVKHRLVLNSAVTDTFNQRARSSELSEVARAPPCSSSGLRAANDGSAPTRARCRAPPW